MAAAPPQETAEQSPTILVDDTRGPIATWAYSTFREDIGTLSGLTIGRKGSLKWVQNLRYLAYDDDSDSDCSDSDDSNSGDKIKVDEDPIVPTDFERGFSVILQTPDARRERIEELESYAEYLRQTDPDCELPEVLASLVPTTPQNSNISRPHEDETDVIDSELEEEPRSCAFCQSLPTFPKEKRPNKFRLVQFNYDDAVDPENGLKQCIHYAAVSYCWPKDSDGNAVASGGTYRIRDVLADGTVVERATRAPDAIIDRAVSFARQEGLRLIWIDQECIPKDDREQNVGIQAMDLVYQQAISTVGILQSCKITTAEGFAITAISDWYDAEIDLTDVRTFLLPRDFPILDLGRQLVSFLSNFINDPWNSRAWILQEMFSAGEDAQISIPCVPDLEWLQESSMITDISCHNWDLVTLNIKVEQMLNILHACKTFFTCIFTTMALSAEEQHLAQKAEAESIMDSFGCILRSLDGFHPDRVAFQDLSSRLTMIGGTSLGSRRRCNAAVALTYLKSRDNTRPVDRLAILANLCDYEVRFDIAKVERRIRSLTTCTVALALMNGDFSLMPSEIYQYIPPKGSPTGLPRWAMRFHELLPSIESRNLKPGEYISLRNPRRYGLEAHGFTIPGYLWSVDRPLDLTALQARCMEDWLLLDECIDTFKPLQEQHYDHAEFCQHCKPRVRITNVHQDLLGRNSVPVYTNGRTADGEGENADQKQTCLCPTLGLRTYLVQKTNWHRSLNLMASIFWEVLQYLCCELKETAVANSLWHSIRETHFGGKLGDGESRAESEDQELPDEVEKILEKGKDFFQPLRRLFQIDSSVEYFWSQFWILKRIMSEGILWVGRYHLPVDSWPKAEMEADRERQHELKPLDSQILSRQILFQNLAVVHRISATDTDYDPYNNIGSYITLVEAFSGNLWTQEYERRRSERVSVFDVDGPCLIFTPYDSDVERLPRPDCRSLGWAWVVEEDTTKADEDQSFHGSTDLQIVHDVNQLSLTSATVKDDVSESVTSQNSEIDEDGPRHIAKLRVLDSVKGAWECMEIPHQTYLFV